MKAVAVGVTLGLVLAATPVQGAQERITEEGPVADCIQYLRHHLGQDDPPAEDNVCKEALGTLDTMICSGVTTYSIYRSNDAGRTTAQGKPAIFVHSGPVDVGIGARSGGYWHGEDLGAYWNEALSPGALAYEAASAVGAQDPISVVFYYSFAVIHGTDCPRSLTTSCEDVHACD